jgi:hypothetical protein
MSVVSNHDHVRLWSSALISVTSLPLDGDQRRRLKHAMLSNAKLLAPALAVLLSNADVADFVDSVRTLLKRAGADAHSDDAHWRMLAESLLASSSAQLGVSLTRTSNNAAVAAQPAAPVRAAWEFEREQQIRALVAVDVHQLNKELLRDDTETRFDCRATVNDVFMSPASLPPVAPTVAIAVAPKSAELSLALLEQRPRADFALAAQAPPAESLDQFVQPTAFALSTFSHGDVERIAAAHRNKVAAAVVDESHAAAVIETVAVHAPVVGARSYELSDACAFLEAVAAALASKPSELDHFFHVFEEFQRNRSATVAASVGELYDVLIANKLPALAKQLVDFLPTDRGTGSATLAHRLATSTASEFRIGPAAHAETSLESLIDATYVLEKRQEQQLQEQQQQQQQQALQQALQQAQQSQRIAFFVPPKTLLPTTPTQTNVYQQAVLQKQQDVVFVAPTMTSALLGGAPDSADAAIERQARRKALMALKEPRAVRESAAVFVRAAARFGGGVDRRFLEIMRDHCAGALDRAQVAAQISALFAESNDVERDEGQQMIDAFKSIRARAQRPDEAPALLPANAVLPTSAKQPKLAAFGFGAPAQPQPSAFVFGKPAAATTAASPASVPFNAPTFGSKSPAKGPAMMKRRLS